jgi:hypothetical protein
LAEQLKKIKESLGEALEVSDDDQDSFNGSEMGEDELDEDQMGEEMGEDEIDEEDEVEGEEDVPMPNDDGDINYNNVMDLAAVSSSDSEEDIIASTIKSRKAPTKVEKLDPKGQSKLQKTEYHDVGASLKKDQANLKNEMEDFRDNMGKTAIPDAKNSGPAEIEFEYVAPSEAYFHIVRALLNSYLDGKDQEELNLSAMSDHILERASIGSVLASSLGKDDPERNQKYSNLPDEEFEKVVL